MEYGHEFSKNQDIALKIGIGLISYVPRKIAIYLWGFANNLSGNSGLAFRYIIAKRIFLFVGHNVYIGKDVEIVSMEKLKIGSNVSIHRFCYIDATGGVEIGNDVSIAHHSSILSSNHSWDNRDIPIKYNKIIKEETIIDNDVWIGAGVRVLSGACIPRSLSEN